MEAVELNLPVVLIYDKEPRQCNHCGAMNRGVYLVGDGVLCYKCYGQYLEDPDPSFWGLLLCNPRVKITIDSG